LLIASVIFILEVFDFIVVLNASNLCAILSIFLCSLSFVAAFAKYSLAPSSSLFLTAALALSINFFFSRSALFASDSNYLEVILKSRMTSSKVG